MLQTVAFEDCKIEMSTSKSMGSLKPLPLCMPFANSFSRRPGKNDVSRHPVCAHRVRGHSVRDFWPSSKAALVLFLDPWGNGVFYQVSQKIPTDPWNIPQVAQNTNLRVEFSSYMGG